MNETVQKMDSVKMKHIIEVALMATDEPLSVKKIQALFDDGLRPSSKQIQGIFVQLTKEYQERGIELKELATGFIIQVKQAYAPWIVRLWQLRPQRFTAALKETLAIIAYRQPVTRAEIEQIRGVSSSVTLLKTLVSRDWVKVQGYRNSPGKPALYVTTKQFLDYFNLKSLDELPQVDMSELSTGVKPPIIEQLATQVEIQQVD